MQRQCPLCALHLNFIYQARYTGVGVKDYPFKLLQCPKCRLVAVDPAPSNKTYPVSRDEKGAYVGKPLEATYLWNVPLLRHVQEYKMSGELLDLGCNAGDFIALAEKNGFQCTGWEIDEAASTAAKSLGRKVIHGDFLAAKPDRLYDVIVMNHVLEHLPDFTGIGQALAHRLKPDGVVILNIPFFGSWLGQLLKVKWSQLAPFTHAWFYSKESIQKLFTPFFSEIRIHTDSSCEPHTVCTWKWKPLLKGLVVKFFASLNHGDEMRIILRNPIVKNRS